MTTPRPEGATAPASEALLPCPFCGGTPRIVHSQVAETRRVQCCTCEAATMDFLELSSATEWWNRRAAPAVTPEPVSDEEVAAAEIAVQVLRRVPKTWTETMRAVLQEFVDRRMSAGQVAPSVASLLEVLANANRSELRSIVNRCEAILSRAAPLPGADGGAATP